MKGSAAMITRKYHNYDYVEQVWHVTYSINGFEYALYIRGTEPEMQDYMESEMGYVGGYSATTKEETSLLKSLNTKIYIAPQLRNCDD